MYRIAKRFLDLLISSLALIILSPILIIIILLLSITGEKEVFYKQSRIGLNSKRFLIWKFATMLKNSPTIGSKEITLRNDPRVTRIGKVLRITKVNELPQIINVLIGEMAIVGPRPLMEVSYNLYPPEVAQKIYSNKPGITGIGSLIFRDEEKLVSQADDSREMYKHIFEYKAALEIWYYKNASFLTDVKIIFMTGYSIVFPQNKLTERIFPGLPQVPSFSTRHESQPG